MPGKRNPLVLHGDFQRLQFPDHCLDAVYSNSLDHAYELEGVVAEIERVLVPNGAAVIEVVAANRFGRWEATYWTDDNAVAEVFNRAGFKIRGRKRITVPWEGWQFFMLSPS